MNDICRERLPDESRTGRHVSFGRLQTSGSNQDADIRPAFRDDPGKLETIYARHFYVGAIPVDDRLSPVAKL